MPSLFLNKHFNKYAAPPLNFTKYIFTKMLFLQNLSISCPVRIIHGLKDTEVKAEGLIQLTKALDSTDVDLIYRSENGFSVHNVVHTSL